jgi:hypothetical protein
LAVLSLVPVFAFWLEWRLGFITAAYVALGFGAWLESKRP